ncbi:MAG: acyl-CoA thioesterase [Trueperaceae bacterium]
MKDSTGFRVQGLGFGEKPKKPEPEPQTLSLLSQTTTQFHLRVRFAETDQMGIAHHSAYVVWMEAARVEWLRERGVSYKDWEHEGVSLAVSGIELEYRSSSVFDDELIINTRLVEAKSRRFKFEYVMTRVSDNVLLAKGSSLHTPMDKTGKAIRLPQQWLKALTTHLTDG